jgi:phosphotransferase family enzyme
MHLEQALHRPIHRIERRPSRYQTSFRLEELDIWLGEEQPLRLVIKDLSRSTLSTVALKAKPEFSYDPLREIAVYETILAGTSSGPPICYASVGQPDLNQTWLVLERVPGIELYQVGSLEVWRTVARWLSAFHASHQSRPPTSKHLLRYDRVFYLRWLERALEFTGAPLEPIARRYEDVIDLLLALPPTFIHGEFYASNVLVDGLRVAPVDWEVAAIGPGLVDLAALTTGWDDEARRAIESAYGRISQDALDACRLHIALQWLGWSSEWTPPPEHARDWLSDALAAAQRLGF